MAIVRREIKRLNPDTKVSLEEIREVMVNEVIKRDVIEGTHAEEANRKVNRAMKRALRTTQSPSGAGEGNADSGENASEEPA